MEKVQFVFIVLAYRNIDDVKKLIKNLKEKQKNEYRMILIDAKYSDEISNVMKMIADENQIDYYLIENLGYGYGNNYGIEVANNLYDYEYLIISNPDISINNKIIINEDNKDELIIAPQIIAKSGKNQNPYWSIENKTGEILMYYGYLYDFKLLIYFAIIINKIIKMFKKNKVKYIYACHGSFTIFSKRFIREYGFRYDEEMFLFYEEAYLALYAKSKKIRIKYDDSIKVDHYEDGSMGISNINEYSYLKKSFLHYYNRYRKK